MVCLVWLRLGHRTLQISPLTMFVSSYGLQRLVSKCVKADRGIHAAEGIPAGRQANCSLRLLCIDLT